MSSILKALKKVEQKKNERPQFELDVASGVVREKLERRERSWAVPAGMVGVAFLATLVTYLVMSRQHQAAPTNPATTAPGVSQPVATQTQSVPAAPSPAPASAEVSAVPAPVGTTPAAIPTIPAVSQPVSAPRITAKERPSTASPALLQALPPSATAQLPPSWPDRPPQAVQSPPPQRHEPVAAPATHNLKLSGIAWQKDSASRLAVINGTAVSEGTVVDGAKVEEILPDRVRFSAGTRTFEVPLGKIQN